MNNLKKLAALSVVSVVMLSACKPAEKAEPHSAYLFAYFTGNSKADESIHFAVSDDGFNYSALNSNQPVILSEEISRTGGVRDPHILRGHDGKSYYMVVTDMVCHNGWDSNRGMVLLKSDDLVNWKHSAVHFPERYAGQDSLKRVWAPQTIYDPEAGKYLVYFSLKYGDGQDVIHYAYANNDFTDLEGDPKPFFIPKDGKPCIDGDIVEKDGKYYMFYKTEGHGDGIKIAVTESLTSGKWEEQPDYKQQTEDAVEGAGTFKLIGDDRYILMYDVYKAHRYEFAQTTDLENFEPVKENVTMDFRPRHGTVMTITDSELQRLKEKWGNAE